MAAHEVTNWMWNEACAMIERADRLRRDLYQPGMGAEITGWEPPVDVFDTENGVQAPLTSVDVRDLKLGTVANVLVVSGARRLPAIACKATIQPEVPKGRFERRISFRSTPVKLDPWQLESGCLAVVLSKRR
jgi:HSP20 family protein